MNLSNSIVNEFMSCPKRYYWRYVRNIAPLKVPDAIQLGTDFHESAETGIINAELDENMQAVFSIYQSERLNTLTFKEKEMVLSAPLPNTNHTITGILDGLVVNSDGTLSLYELKTTSKSPFDKLVEVMRNRQVKLYHWLLAQNGINVENIIIDVVSTLKLPTQPTLLKNGKVSLNKNQKTTTRLFQEFCATNDYTPTDEETLFFEMNFPDSYSPWLTDTIYPIYNIEEVLEPFYWVSEQKVFCKNEGSCNNYGKCPYILLCNSNNIEIDIKNNYKILDTYRK